MRADRDTQQIPSSLPRSAITRTNGAPPAGVPKSSSKPPGQNLNTSEKHENDNDEENETYASRGAIAPLTAVRPSRQSTQQRQDQKD